MQIFINEWSFQSQHVQSVFNTAVAKLLRMVERSRRAVAGRGTLWRSERLAEVCAAGPAPLKSHVYRIRDREVREAFIDVVFNKANPAPWEQDRRHPCDVSYTCECNDEVHDVRDTSIAELAERRCLDGDLLGCLLNLSNSPLCGSTLTFVLKATEIKIELRSFEEEEDLSAWLDEIDDESYPTTADGPPRDLQTCLRDLNLFESVPKLLVQGRQVYRHRTSQKLYYIDNMHAGTSAHLEVFDKRGKCHLGEADLEGRMIPGTEDKTKKSIR